MLAFWVVHPDRVTKDKPVANAMQHNMVGFIFDLLDQRTGRGAIEVVPIA